MTTSQLNNFFPGHIPWSNPVIPLWEVGVKEDSELFFDLRSHFSPCGVDLVENIDGNFSTGFRARFRHQLLHQLDTGEDHALTGAREVRKQPMLKRVVLGGVGGECATRISRPSACTSWVRSALNRYVRALWLPPPAPRRSSAAAVGYGDCP
jgi:hypothetical protein